MHPAVLSALAALGGSAVGAMAPIVSSYVAQRGQLQRDILIRDIEKRQILYGDFIKEASRLYARSLTRDLGDVEEMVELLAISSRLQLYSSEEVLSAADDFVRQIVTHYGQPNKTVAELQSAMLAQSKQPLQVFSAACRKELLRLRTHPSETGV